VRRPLLLLSLLALPVLAAACGGGDARPTIEDIGPAAEYRLDNFQPAGPVSPGGPTTVAFAIDQPSGERLTRTNYRRGPGPHTGVHVIVVRDDLSDLIHRHPPVQQNGEVSEQIDFPQPGRYRVVVDAYPQIQGGPPNFQLFEDVQVGSTDTEAPVPPFRRTVMVDGYRVTLLGKARVRALQPTFLEARVTDPQGRPARFTPYYGALAHAIFFRAGSLDYFHTHVCGPNTPGCTSVVGNANLTGKSSAPGRLRLGVLLPVPGTWRLFLQFESGGQVRTAPFTLRVR
jgi:hypothetical protein